MAAFDAFLKIEGIDGESADKDHKNEIDVLSFSFGVNNPSSGTPSGGGGGRATAEDFTFSHLIDKASPNLFLACATGKHINRATLTLRKGGNSKGEYLVVKMDDVFISSVAPHFNKAEGDLPTENVSFNYQKVDMTETANDGSVTEISFAFNKA